MFVVICGKGGLDRGEWSMPNSARTPLHEEIFPSPQKNEKSCLGVDFPTSISQGVGGRVEREG